MKLRFVAPLAVLLAVFAAIGILASLALVTRLTVRDAVILGAMLALAGINWAVGASARARRAEAS